MMLNVGCEEQLCIETICQIVISSFTKGVQHFWIYMIFVEKSREKKRNLLFFIFLIWVITSSIIWTVLIRWPNVYRKQFIFCFQKSIFILYCYLVLFFGLSWLSYFLILFWYYNFSFIYFSLSIIIYYYLFIFFFGYRLDLQCIAVLIKSDPWILVLLYITECPIWSTQLFLQL